MKTSVNAHVFDDPITSLLARMEVKDGVKCAEAVKATRGFHHTNSNSMNTYTEITQLGTS